MTHTIRGMQSDPTARQLALWLSLLGLLVFSMVLVPLRDVLGPPNVAIILLLAVQAIAISTGRLGGVYAAIVAAISFDFFFTEPYLRIVINDRQDIITALLLLVAGIATSELSHLLARSERDSVAD